MIFAANTVRNINKIGCGENRGVHLIAPRGGYCPVVVHECLSLFEQESHIHCDGLLLYKMRDVRISENEGALNEMNVVSY